MSILNLLCRTEWKLCVTLFLVVGQQSGCWRLFQSALGFESQRRRGSQPASQKMFQWMLPFTFANLFQE